MKLPESWLLYKKCARINNTPFVASKTPLRKNFSTKLSSEQSFTPEDLLETYPRIKLVIDLTNTYKYYSGAKEFIAKGVQHVKIRLRGHGIVPSDMKFIEFANAVDQFLSLNRGNYLIAVHCTHGVNRTGYFIVRYMMERMGYKANVALREFFQSRGHAVNRIPLIHDLLKRDAESALRYRR